MIQTMVSEDPSVAESSVPMLQTWDALTPSRGPVMGGGATVTLQGNAFDRTQTYTCTFTDRRE